VQTCGRRLGQYVKRKARAKSEARRREVFNLYIEEVVNSVEAITGKDQKLFRDRLLAISRRKTELAGMLEEAKGAAAGDDLEACENVLVVDPDAEPPAAPPAAAEAVSDGEDPPVEKTEAIVEDADSPGRLPPPIPAESESDGASQLELI